MDVPDLGSPETTITGSPNLIRLIVRLIEDPISTPHFKSEPDLGGSGRYTLFLSPG